MDAWEYLKKSYVIHVLQQADKQVLGLSKIINKKGKYFL